MAQRSARAFEGEWLPSWAVVVQLMRIIYGKGGSVMHEPLRTITNEMIVDLIRVQVPDIEASRPLLSDADLWSAGMDSLSSVAVIVAVEEQFGVEFPDELLTREVFSSAAAIAEAVRNMVGQDSMAL
ncbi:phosphopantetheine-binding protein [Streptomyces sp. MT29]|nr:phosphopantetheine-binding protein [Streptomyces sp. MT29]